MIAGALICCCDLMSVDVGLMRSTTDPRGNHVLPTSYEYGSMADGGAPVKYDKTLLAGDDGEGLSVVYFAAAEIETWQL